MAVLQTFGSVGATINQEPSQCLWCQVARYHHTKCCLRSLDPGTREKKGNSSMTSLMVGSGSIQRSTTCDPAQNPDAGQLGAVVLKEI